RLKKIQYIKRPKRDTKLFGLENFADFTEVGKITITIQPRAREGSLNSFRGAMDKSKGIVTTGLQEYNPDRAKFTVSVNNRDFTVGSDLEAVGRPAFFESIEVDDEGRPSLGEV